MILFIIQIYNSIIYGFETNNKIITSQTVEIGTDGESYILPASIGNPGQVLILNQNGELEWRDLPAPPNLPAGDVVVYPYLKTENECPPNTCFLPTRRREGKIAKGYCMATNVPNTDPLHCTDDQWAGVFSDGLTLVDSLFYCEKTYGEGAVMPTTNFLWPDLAYLLEPPRVVKGISKYLEHFTEDDNNSIQKFEKNLRLDISYVNKDGMRLRNDRDFDASQMHKGILTRELNTYLQGCLFATVLLHPYYPDANLSDISFYLHHSREPTPYILGHIPVNTKHGVVSDERGTRNMSRFRILCIR